MRILIILFTLTALFSCSGSRKAVDSSTDTDTTYQEQTRLVNIKDLPGIAPAPGQPLVINTPDLQLRLDRISPELVAITHTRPVIRQKVTQTRLIPVKIKDKSRTKIITETTTGSHNTHKDKSQEGSNNRHKEKKTDITPLLIILLILLVIAYLVWRFKR